MFKFLKDKIKSAVSKISEKIEEEGKQEEIEAPKEEPKKIEQQAISQPKVSEVPNQEEAKTTPDDLAQQGSSREEKKGFFSKVKSIFTKKEEAAATVPKEDSPEPLKGPAVEPVIEKPIDTTKIEHFAPHVVEEVKKEFIAPKEEPKHELKQEEATPEPTKHAPKPIHAPRPLEHPKQIHKPEPKPEQKSEPKKEAKPIAAPSVPTPASPPIAKQHPATKVPTPAPKAPEKITVQETPTSLPPPKQPEEEKKGFFSALKEKILTTTINEPQFEDMFFDLELALLENNVAVEVIDKIKHDLKSSLVNHPIRRSKVEETVILSLKDSIRGLFESPFDLISKIKGKSAKPFIIAFVGINGSGKTTSIAKMAFMLKEQGFSVVLAAGDTFRAASIEQLAQHGDKLGIKVIRHDYGADPAAVAFDAIKHAEAKNVDVVLIDTAGRMHSNENLIQEMQKIIRVAKPDVKLFVGESITGNDCVEQAKSFNEAIGLDGIILSKADIDEKGGAAVSVSYVTKKPILYIGTGQEYKDIKPFDAAVVMENLGLEG